MSPVFAARRRAEEFNSLVEGTSTRELHDTRTMELAELVGALRQTPAATPRAEFVSGLRERLMAEAATTLSPAGRDAARAAETDDRLTVTPRRSPRERRIAAAVGGFAIVGATTSMAVAAQSALPGDTLYPLKRAMENAQAGFSVSDSQKGATLLDNASGRLHEVEALSRAEKTETESVETIALTFAAFIEQASAASELLIADYEENGSADAIAELRDFTASSMAALSDLESVLPDGARAALIQAAQVLTQIDAHAAALCSVCGGEGISVIPPFAIRAVEDVVGGLAGALTRPLETTEGRQLQQAGTGKAGGKGGGKGARSGKGGSTAGSGQQAQQPTTQPSQPPTFGGGGQPRGDQPTAQPSTLGDVVEGVLGGGTGGTGGKTSSSPTTVPEVIDEVVEGVEGAVDSLLP